MKERFPKCVLNKLSPVEDTGMLVFVVTLVRKANFRVRVPGSNAAFIIFLLYNLVRCFYPL